MALKTFLKEKTSQEFMLCVNKATVFVFVRQKTNRRNPVIVQIYLL